MSLKVLVIHNGGRSNLPSGEFVVANEEVQVLREKGYDANLCVMSNDIVVDKWSFKRVAAGINIFWSYESFQTTKELIRRHTPDIVHFHSVLPLLTASAFYACRSERIPVIQTLHNYRWFCVEGGLFKNGSYCDECLIRGDHRGILQKCSRDSFSISSLLTLNNRLWVKSKRLFDLVDRFIAVSNFVKDKYVLAGFPENKITVKYNGTRRNKLVDNNGIANDRIGITFVGRLTPAKGTKILKDIIRHFKGVPLNIVGDGPDFEVLNELCRMESNVNVKFMGKQSATRVQEIMAKSACVVVPSLFAEPFGLVAVEAMACGTPVVASGIGGLAEIVERSGGGVTVSPEEGSKGFLEAIKGILASPTKASEMGARGELFVSENFTMDKSANCLLDIYRQTLQEKSK